MKDEFLIEPCFKISFKDIEKYDDDDFFNF